MTCNIEYDSSKAEICLSFWMINIGKKEQVLIENLIKAVDVWQPEKSPDGYEYVFAERSKEDFEFLLDLIPSFTGIGMTKMQQRLSSYGGY